MNSKTKDFRQKLIDEFIRTLEEKPEAWAKEWQGVSGIPYNGASGRAYHGINRLYLQFIGLQNGHKDPRWYTFKQASDAGCKIKKDSKGTKVEYWFMWDTQNKKTVTPNEYLEMTEEQKEKVTWQARHYTVFNAEQIEGIAPLQLPENLEVTQAELITRISENMQVPIINDGGDRAFYRPVSDEVHLPLPKHFFSEYAYNATALHELAHATGHPKRLNRTFGSFGSENYAKEELVAELTSCFMSAELPIEQTEEHVKNHKAYIKGWIAEIKEKPEEFFKAVKNAEEAAAYLEKAAGISNEKSVTVTIKTENSPQPEAKKQPKLGL